MRDETLALHAGFDACHFGIEHGDGIIADLGQVLAAAMRGRVRTVP